MRSSACMTPRSIVPHCSTPVTCRTWLYACDCTEHPHFLVHIGSMVLLVVNFELKCKHLCHGWQVFMDFGGSTGLQMIPSL